MEILVVTGGIGSGKSEVCRILHEHYGCGVYQADSRTKELYYSHPSLLTDIERALGTEFRSGDGVFHPRKLAELIFTDRNSLEKLESILFPVLLEDFSLWARSYADDRFVVFESATILEKPALAGFGDRLMIVDAPYEMRLVRACRRDGASESDVRARMQLQVLMNSISEGAGYDAADAILRNTGGVDDLYRQVIEAVESIFANN